MYFIISQGLQSLVPYSKLSSEAVKEVHGKSSKLSMYWWEDLHKPEIFWMMELNDVTKDPTVFFIISVKV